jgi:hypothetical protein
MRHERFTWNEEDIEITHPDDKIEKAGKKDKSKLTKKIVVDKRGKRTTVYVNTQKDKKKDPFVKQYVAGLKDLKSAFKKRAEPFTMMTIAKQYYTKAMQMAVDKKLIDNKTRLAINRNNKKIGIESSHDEDYQIMMDGIDMVLNKLK